MSDSTPHLSDIPAGDRLDASGRLEERVAALVRGRFVRHLPGPE